MSRSEDAVDDRCAAVQQYRLFAGLGIGQFRDADDVAAGLEDERPDPERTDAVLNPPVVSVENRTAWQRPPTGGT